jgi:hypothetical protein
VKQGDDEEILRTENVIMTAVFNFQFNPWSYCRTFSGCLMILFQTHNGLLHISLLSDFHVPHCWDWTSAKIGLHAHLLANMCPFSFWYNLKNLNHHLLLFRVSCRFGVFSYLLVWHPTLERLMQWLSLPVQWFHFCYWWDFSSLAGLTMLMKYVNMKCVVVKRQLWTEGQCMPDQLSNVTSKLCLQFRIRKDAWVSETIFIDGFW